MIVSLVLLALLSVAEAQFKLLQAPDQLLDIRVLSASAPPPRTRKIHSIATDLPPSVVRVLADTKPTKSSKYRGYKSKCRCESIWKCQKMQLSIARCPPDHFMCCF